MPYKCPICSKELNVVLSKMRGFTWTDPYAECSCGFSFDVKNKDQAVSVLGRSQFEVEKSEALSANDKLTRTLSNFG